MTILMIDNYDSFTYNLVQYLGELGADVQVRRNDTITLDEVEALAPAAVVISPGPCTPNEAGISVPLLRRFAAKPGRFLTVSELLDGLLAQRGGKIPAAELAAMEWRWLAEKMRKGTT